MEDLVVCADAPSTLQPNPRDPFARARGPNPRGPSWLARGRALPSKTFGRLIPRPVLLQLINRLVERLSRFRRGTTYPHQGKLVRQTPAEYTVFQSNFAILLKQYRTDSMKHLKTRHFIHDRKLALLPFPPESSVGFSAAGLQVTLLPSPPTYANYVHL